MGWKSILLKVRNWMTKKVTNLYPWVSWGCGGIVSYACQRIGLILFSFLFGISTFVGYFVPNSSFFEGIHLIHNPHHHVVSPARISLTLSRYFSLSFIASVRSSGLHPVSSHSCCIYFRAGRPAFARPYVGVHRSKSLMSSYLLLQQCSECLVRLTWIVFVMGGRWPYSWCFVGCCLQDLYNIARSVLV